MSDGLGRKTGAGFYAYENGDYARLDLALPDASATLDERVCIIGFYGVADELALALEPKCPRVQRILNDELLDDLDREATLVIDVGDGFSDRADILVELDRTFDATTVIFADAYVTDLGALASRLRHPPSPQPSPKHPARFTVLYTTLRASHCRRRHWNAFIFATP